MNQIFSDIDENNIFHIFEWDIIRHYSPHYQKALIFQNNIDKNHPTQKWRYFVMKKLYGSAEYTQQKYASPLTFGGFDCFNFIKYKPNYHLLNIYHKFNPKRSGKYILLVQRNENDRYLYDYNTKLDLQTYLNTKKFKLPVKWCNFENLTPEEQYEICSSAALFISAHGSACTNLIFTPKQTPCIEINFRKYWYCDNVCDDHFYQKISINQKCHGKLNYCSYFHKADYHNLCYLLGKKHVEMEAIEYGGKFNSRNPISKQQIYIDGNALEKHINELLKDIIWQTC